MPETRVARAVAFAVDALFAVVAVALLDAFLLPIPLTVPPECAECVSNVPRLPLIPFLAALALSLATEPDARLSRRLVRGLALGAGTAAYAGLIAAAAIPFHDPYFVAPYRVYALGYVAFATCLATIGITAISAEEGPQSRQRLAQRLTVVGLVTLVGAAAQGEILITAGGAGGAAAGLALARVRGLWRPSLSRLTPDRAAITIAIAAIALRLLFGLQTLARTGPGHAFSLASDDGQSYYRNATEMLADPGYVDTILRAIDGFPPLYSFFLWAIFAVTHESMAAVVVAQALLAGAACVLVYVLGRRYLSAWVGAIAALLFATDQNLIQNQSTLTAEAVLLPLLLLGLWALTRYGRERSLVWLVCAAVALALVFFTRNLLALTIPAAIVWLLWLRPRQPLSAIGAGLVLVAAVLVVGSPVAIATGRAESSPRLTNQRADLSWYIGRTPHVIDNGFLVARGIQPFTDPAGSLTAAVRDPLPVLGFYVQAVPQRLGYLLFSVEFGASDPLTITNPATYANRFGQLVELLLILSALVAALSAIRQRAWVTHPEIMLLVLFVVLYLATFALVFPPWQAFRYRIPIVPLLMIAQAVGLWLLARGVVRAWRSNIRWPETNEGGEPARLSTVRSA
ncbi:MAG TPA: glycosyltransferase family 39 protein [Vicinamibacterales bacterium]|nr:glycosyltransferase family 39 protein [Vicinamibacterales bacterium]